MKFLVPTPTTKRETKYLQRLLEMNQAMIMPIEGINPMFSPGEIVSRQEWIDKNSETIESLEERGNTNE